MGQIRRFFPYLMVLGLLGAVGWAVSFGTLPRADFTFINGTEIQSVDPAIVTGQPEGRIINTLFEGLYRPMPDVDDPNKLRPIPAAAQSCEIADDGKTYTFTIRPAARWSNGDPVTADDFAWSWRRFLHPETAAEYAYQLHYVQGAAKFNYAEVEPGDRVEVELADRPDRHQLFPSGTMLSGILTHIDKPPEPKFADGVNDDEREKRLADWKRKWIYVVSVKPEKDGVVDWDAPGQTRRFSKESQGNSAEWCKYVLYHFSQVGISAPSKDKLVVKLNDPTPFFLDLVAFYPLFPVHRGCVEQHGVPNWTKPENIVSNGPFTMKFRRIRDRIRMEKNPHYWDADKIELQTIDALAVESQATQLNMYMNGQVDWATDIPNAMIPELQKRDDFYNDTQLGTYYYRINTTRAPLDDVRVRKALALSLDKGVICDFVTRGGQKPARSFVPPGLPGYEGSLCGEFDLTRARELLAEAGYPGGRGFRRIEILYNTSEAHRDIAEVVQQQWKSLGVDAPLKNLAWSVYLDFAKQKKYDIARAGWIGDYPDPNTFLDMFVTDGANNQTGWGNRHYDELIEAAKSESDRERRMALFRDAEAILMDNWEEVADERIRGELLEIRRQDPKAGGLPIIPIYFYVAINIVRPYVQGVPPYDKFNSGFFGNIQDVHPLHIIRIDEDEKRRVLSQRGLR